MASNRERATFAEERAAARARGEPFPTFEAWLPRHRAGAAPSMAALIDSDAKPSPPPVVDSPTLADMYSDTPATPAPLRSQRVAVVGDVHFPSHSERHWNAFRAWHADHKPDWTVLNGDMMDMAAISRFKKGPDDPATVLPEVEYFVREVNALAAECGRITFNVGNHEDRYAAAVGGDHAQALKGLLGLDLHSLLQRHGLTERLEWCRERVGFRGIEIGNALARHGDKQAGKFSGKYVAATALGKMHGRNVAISHHHKGQLHAETAEDRTVWGVAIPCMQLEQGYMLGPPWVRGFAEFQIAPCGETTPYVIIMHPLTGRFSYNGRVYGG